MRKQEWYDYSCGIGRKIAPKGLFSPYWNKLEPDFMWSRGCLQDLRYILAQTLSKGLRNEKEISIRSGS